MYFYSSYYDNGDNDDEITNLDGNKIVNIINIVF